MIRDPAWRRYERFYRRDLEQDVDDELASHYEMLIDASLARGLPRDQADVAARKAMSGAESAAKECRSLSLGRARQSDRRTFRTDVLNDFKTAVRLAWSQPLATIAMIGSAAAALLAATIVFCAADRMFIQRPPFLADYGRTHRVYVHGQSFFGDARFLPSVTYRQFSNVRAHTTAFDAVVAAHDAELLAGPPTSTLRWAQTTLASSQYWSLFDARPELGTFYSANEETTAVAVISNRVWRSQFGGDPNVVGREVRIGAASFHVIGVMPRGFVGLHGPPSDYVVPFRSGIPAITGRVVNPDAILGQWVSLIVRRAPNVSAEVATAQLSRAFGDSSAPARGLLAPIQFARGPARTDSARLAGWMVLLAALLLISATTNLAALQTTRIARRRRELAIRTALGMSRVRLARMIVVDTALQLGVAAIIALAVAATVGASVAHVAFPDLPAFRTDEPLRLGAFIVVAASLVGVVAGFGAALYATRVNPVEGLNECVSGGARRRFTIRRAAMAVQSSAALVLVVCATVFVFSLRDATAVRLGYDADRLVWATSQPRHGASRDELRADLERLRTALAKDPSVERVALADRAPRMSVARTRVFVDSSEVPSSIEIGYHRVGRGYFDAMGMRIREGRAFSMSASGANEIVVSEAMADRIAPHASTLGMCLRLGRVAAPCRTVVGVVNDTRDMRLDGATTSGYYVLSPPSEEWQSGLIIRARSSSGVRLAQGTAARLSTTNFAVESYAVSTLVAEGRRDWQAGAVVLSLLASAAILLSIVGLSSTIGEDATRRMHEFAIRSAVGANRFQLAALVAREGALSVAKMIAIGAPAAVLVVVSIRPLLFAAAAALLPSVVAGVLVAIVVLLSTSLPALHLRRVDAAEVLRATN